MTDIRLPGPRQRALFDALQGRGDVDIDTLFGVVNGPRHLYPTHKGRQQYLGTYFTHLNRRLRPHGLTVRPGERKRTYRLIVSVAAPTA
jgi:hypothetical protein